MVAPSSYAAMP